jgi:uncharacterized protein YbjT (DUF2867 family)
MSSTYLITAPSGNIGTHLVPLLLSRASKPTIVLLTSNAERLRSQLPENVSEDRVKIAHGDIQDPIFVETTARRYGATAAFVCLTGENELMLTMNFFNALQRAGSVKHVVYVSGCGGYGLDAISRAAGGALQKNTSGHVVVKYIIEAKLRHGVPPRSEQGGFSWTILGPTLFFSNDLRSKKALLERAFFDEPLGDKGVSRVDPADIALAAANALEDDGKVWGGKKVMIGSLETYTNKDTAKLWSSALGAEVTAILSDKEGLDATEEYFRNFLSPMWARDLRLMYEYFGQEGFGMTQTEYDDQVALLGKAPSSYEEFVRTTAEGWKSS